ncbi:hypothetical protein BDN71DRAFT_1514714 [Pleurotus eryngii]|uniref:Uncharacterized protein n=1 Tax=Pleurotus eryngii TaxID=5323 RepID=A0A9P5ZFX3_PLEER|nr:hypothetical protein BDN71DRAFT_1514714 [Pleurotus eryngii]
MAGKIMMTISAWHDTSHTQLWKYTQGGGEDIVVDETDSWLAHQVDDHLEALSQCMAFEFPEEVDKINDMARSIRSTLIAAYSTEPEDEDEISPLRSPEATQMLESEDEVRKVVMDKEEHDADVPIPESEAEIEAEMSRFTGPPGAYISVEIEAEMPQLDSTSGGYISDIMEEDEPSFPLPFSLAMWGPSTQDEDRFLSNLKRQGIALTDNEQDKHSPSPVDSNMDYSDDNAEAHAPPCAQPVTDCRWIPFGHSPPYKFSCFDRNFLFPFHFASVSWQVERKLFKSVYGFWSSAYFGALKSIRQDPYDNAIFPTEWLAKHYGQVHGMQERKKIRLFLSCLFTLNRELKARAQQLAEVLNHWRFIACWADTNCLRLSTEEQEKELLRKGQEVLLVCVDEFLENYMHSRIARYTKLASDALEEASLLLKPNLKKKIQILVQRDVLVWVLISKMKVALSYNKIYSSPPL